MNIEEPTLALPTAPEAPVRARVSAAQGRLLVLAAALLWSTSGLFVKSPPLEAIPQAERGPLLACFRTLFAAGCLLPFVRPSQIRWRPGLVPMVVSFTLMNVLFLTAMTRTTAAAAIFLQYTSTAWAFGFGWFFLAEPISRGNAVAALCAVAGIAWIVAADWSGERMVGNVIGLCSGFAYAGVVVTLRVLRDESTIWLVSLNHVVAGLLLLPWALAQDVSLTALQWLLIAMLGMGQMALPYLLFARGVRGVTAQEAALIPLIEPLLNPFWVWLFWREPVPGSTWIGGSMILGGLLIRYLLFPRDAAKPVESAQATNSERFRDKA